MLTQNTLLLYYQSPLFYHTIQSHPSLKLDKTSTGSVNVSTSNSLFSSKAVLKVTRMSWSSSTIKILSLLPVRNLFICFASCSGERMLSLSSLVWRASYYSSTQALYIYITKNSDQITLIYLKFLYPLIFIFRFQFFCSPFSFLDFSFTKFLQNFFYIVFNI